MVIENDSIIKLGIGTLTSTVVSITKPLVLWGR